MKIQAITICIHYSDFLHSVLANRIHFDRWLIVTVPEDMATVDLCRSSGLEYVFCSSLEPDGWDFDAKTRKAAAVNQALDMLDPEGWVVVLDADILLPRTFRDQVTTFPLSEGALYGLAGCIVCADPLEFAERRRWENWVPSPNGNDHDRSVFQMFSLEAQPNRFPDRTEDDLQSDVGLLTEAFAGRRRLNFCALHAGPRGINNNGRVSGPFLLRDLESLEPRPHFITSELQAAGVPPDAAVILGKINREELFEWVKSFEKVYVLASETTGEELVYPDGKGKVERVPHNSLSAIQQIDSPISVLYLPGESAADCDPQGIKLWSRKLHRNGLICGDCWGIKHWTANTEALVESVGNPDIWRPDGFWIKRARVPIELSSERIAHSNQRGIVIVSADSTSGVHTFLTLQSAREAWDGPIEIMYWGKKGRAVERFASRIGVSYRDMGVTLEKRGCGHLRWMEARALSPFESSIILVDGTLFSGSADNLFNLQGNVCARGHSGELSTRNLIQQLPIAFAQTYSADGAELVTFAGNPEEWSEEAWALWSRTEAASIHKSVREIPTPGRTVVITIVEPASAATFERSLLTWRFPNTRLCKFRFRHIDW